MNPSTLATVLIFVMLFCILVSLGASLYYLVTDQGRTKRTVNALSVRIILSFVLFAALLIAFVMGWIAPHGLMHH
ncbi:MAG TPA: twin transmembrane helix small protein [Gammaproteobacteria bacterium]|nr:twin transmembrane helix small protein [Gammaproteobacteria bacterium]